jgi:drug/metabolite transporter (DMT)-like permease
MPASLRPIVTHPLLALVLLSLIWGYSWVLSKVGLQFTDPLTYAVLRIGFGTACLFLVLALTGRRLRPTRPGMMCVLGVIQVTGYVGLSVWATAEGTAGRTAMLVFTMPFWTMLIAWPVLGERLERLQWLVAVIAMAGLAMIINPLHWRVETTLELRSKVLAVAAGLCWAIGSIMLKRLQRQTPLEPLSMTAWQMLFGTVPLLLLSAIRGWPSIQWTPLFTMTVVYNAVLTSAAGWWLWVYALKRLPSGMASMSMFAVPALALLLSWLHLGERPDRLEGTGIALLALALLILTASTARRHLRLRAVADNG